MSKATAKVFRTRLERLDSPLKWVVVWIPFDVEKAWGKRGQLKVRGEINGFAFRTSLFPRGDGKHVLLVNKGMQRGGNTGIGMLASFRLQPDIAPRTLQVPTELKRILARIPSLRRWVDGLSYSTRNDISKWILQVKSPEARERRSNQIAERMYATMEAEQDIPPVLEIALARNALARQGWNMMPPGHRRRHLMAIFYYRTPEARERRTAKVVQEAAAYAERKKRARKALAPS